MKWREEYTVSKFDLKTKLLYEYIITKDADLWNLTEKCVFGWGNDWSFNVIGTYDTLELAKAAAEIYADKSI